MMRLFTISAIFLVLCSCGGMPSKSVSTSIDPMEEVSHEYAYIYGNFKMADSAARANGRYMAMAHMFECDNGDKYRIQFSIDKPIQMIKVKPATCSFSKTLFILDTGAVYSEKDSSDSFLKDINLEAGTAYYVGDYFAMAFRNQMQGSWNLKKFEDKFNETTDKINNIFKVDANFKKVNLLTKDHILINTIGINSPDDAYSSLKSDMGYTLIEKPNYTIFYKDNDRQREVWVFIPSLSQDNYHVIKQVMYFTESNLKIDSSIYCRQKKSACDELLKNVETYNKELKSKLNNNEY